MSNFEDWNKAQHKENSAHQDRTAEHAHSSWNDMHLLRERSQQGTAMLPQVTIEDRSHGMPRTDMAHVAGNMLKAVVQDNQTRSHINELHGQFHSNVTQHNNFQDYAPGSYRFFTPQGEQAPGYYQHRQELPAAGFRSYIHSGNELLRNRR